MDATTVRDRTALNEQPKNISQDTFYVSGAIPMNVVVLTLIKQYDIWSLCHLD